MQKLLYRHQNVNKTTLILGFIHVIDIQKKNTGPNTDPCGTLNVMFTLKSCSFWLRRSDPISQLILNPALHDTSDAVMQEVTHQYVMINCV